jgi:hypothetical protein
MVKTPIVNIMIVCDPPNIAAIMEPITMISNLSALSAIPTVQFNPSLSARERM